MGAIAPTTFSATSFPTFSRSQPTLKIIKHIRYFLLPFPLPQGDLEMAISLELIHPSGLISLRNWTFEKESVIRIGRERNNHVVLHSRVVSRFHAMLWGFGNEWKIVNLSCNGTYLDNTPVTHALLTDGAVIRLAPSGPRVRFRILNNRSTRPGIQDPGTMNSPSGGRENGVRESRDSPLKPVIDPGEQTGTFILEPDWEVDKPALTIPKFSAPEFSSASRFHR